MPVVMSMQSASTWQDVLYVVRSMVTHEGALPASAHAPLVPGPQRVHVFWMHCGLSSAGQWQTPVWSPATAAE